MMRRMRSLLPALCVLNLAVSLRADEYILHTFARQQLTDVYYSEGANVGDINRDGHPDIVHGPYWFEGPFFEIRHEIYPPRAQPREGYADNFFSWVYDLDADSDTDVLTVGLPGSALIVYQNPGPNQLDKPWTRTQVFQDVGNESPQWNDIVGDDRPELVCLHEGRIGYAAPDWSRPFDTWSFHPISPPTATGPFVHGLGVGDIDGDGRGDILTKDGWFQQPSPPAPLWTFHPFVFADPGGADMFCYDVDGDGDNDVITSLAAHAFGLAWYEQLRQGERIAFRQHLIVGDHPSKNRYGVVFSEPHALRLADIDGDGLQDIVTGKTYWSHHTQSPMWDAGAVVYWFRLVRTEKGIDWIPYLADGEAGIGRQLTVSDVNGDSLPDIVTGGMKGAHVLIHQRSSVDRATWKAAQPRAYVATSPPSVARAEPARGPLSPIDPDSRRVERAIEAETMVLRRVPTGTVQTQPMHGYSDLWSGDAQLWWTGAHPGDTLELEFAVDSAGCYDVELVMTCAEDYAIVQLALDQTRLGQPVDLYNPDVITTGVLTFIDQQLSVGKHCLSVQLLGANPRAVKAYMFGLDFIRLNAVAGSDARQTGDSSSTGALPSGLDGQPLNLDLEAGSLRDWTAEGEAFAGQPIKGDTVSARRSDMTSRHQGEYWIGGYERLMDRPVGVLTSKPFRVTHRWATFRVGGGRQFETRVELVRSDTGRAIFRVAGRDREDLERVVVDLKPHVGKDIFIRLVDEHDGDWGHINFDDLRFHDAQPGRITPEILKPDEYAHAGLLPDEAARAMKLPPGFAVSVFAAEPDVKQPVALALDDRGRVWIAEAYEYPRRAPEGQGRDRILIFEDADGDGKFDRRKVFAEQLNLVSGLEVGFGGVWVGAAPYLLFIPDRDGDDVPDSQPQILLDGWGYEDTHETLNSFIWGPDGWLYGCHGVFTHSLVGRPGTADDERTPLNAAIWRYHPTRHDFEVFAHGTSNPWGIDFDDHGQAFCTACVIPHLYHVIQGARYVRQAGSHFNPYTYRDIPTIADHVHYLGATPHLGNSNSDEAGGGHAHAGAMIYLGGAWPDQYRTRILMNNVHGQRINVDRLTPRGSGFVASHEPDFLLTNDQASQMLNFRYGPDGHVLVIDWYDMQACHLLQPEAHDRSNGRIYKISYGQPQQAKVDLNELDDAQLAEQALDKNDWYVRHARRILQERAAARPLAEGARKRLVEMARTHPDATRRLRAMWALHVSGDLANDLIAHLLADDDPYVRAWTIQLALDREQPPSAELLARFVALARDDPSQVVRLYLASALQRLAPHDRWPILQELVNHPEDATDQNLTLMYWYAAEPLGESDPQRALAFGLAAGECIPFLRDAMLRRLGSTDTAASLAALVGGLGAQDDAILQLSFLKGIRAALEGQRQVDPPEKWSSVYPKLARSANTEVHREATALAVTFGDSTALHSVRGLAESTQADAATRRHAVETLLSVKDQQLVSTLHRLLADPELRELALRGLALFDDPQTPQAVLKVYSQLSPDEKIAAVATLCSRAAYGIELLQAMENQQVPATDLSADLVRQLKNLGSARIDRMLDTVWGSVRESAADKVALIAHYKQLVAENSDQVPDVALGRAIFAKTCQRCHVLYGIGGQVGPDLTGSNRADLDYLLTNIVDPSTVMAKEYQPSLIVTSDGRVITGIIRSDQTNALTIQTASEVLVVPKDEIEECIQSSTSMMPDDQLRQFRDHEVRSLLAYLATKRQVPMLATPDNVAVLFNGRDLAGWHGRPDLWGVEKGEIVGRSPGLTRNEFLVSDLLVGDFELSLKVKLTPDRGNSGIQFRSQALDNRQVKGYQADIGAGWWGKLYEEEGRGVLYEPSGERFVRRGKWNDYRIVASGDHIRTYINGNLCVDLHDPEGSRRGIIALQLHSGGPFEVRFKDLQLSVHL